MKQFASRASLRSRVSKTQRAWGSTKAARHFSFCILHLSFHPGAWQKSDAPALQAGTSGSVTRRPPPFGREDGAWKMADSARAILHSPSSILVGSALRGESD